MSSKSIVFEEIEPGRKPSRLNGAGFFLLCIIPISATVLFGGVDTGTWAMLVPLVALIALLWIADGLRGKAFVFQPSTMLVPLAALCAIGLVQIGFGLSLDPYSTRLLLIRLVCYTIFFAAALTFVNTHERLSRLTLGIIVFGAAMALFAILQRLGNAEAIYGMRPPGQAVPFGSFVNQHHFAAFMEMTGVLSLSLLVGKSLSREKKFFIAICFLFTSLAIVLTSSRGGLIGLIAGSGFVAAAAYLLRKREGVNGDTAPVSKAVWALAGITGLVLFVGMIVFLGADESLLRATGFSESADDITHGRLHFWSVALKIFLEHPILGAGLDAFGVAFTPHDTWTGTFRIEQAHNDYLQTLADAGLVGFASIAAFIFLLFRNGLRVIACESDGFRVSAAIGALGGCFAILIHSFFDFPLRTPSNAFFFLLLVVIATVPFPERRAEPSSQSPSNLSARRRPQTES